MFLRYRIWNILHYFILKQMQNIYFTSTRVGYHKEENVFYCDLLLPYLRLFPATRTFNNESFSVSLGDETHFLLLFLSVQSLNCLLLHRHIKTVKISVIKDQLCGQRALLFGFQPASSVKLFKCRSEIWDLMPQLLEYFSWNPCEIHPQYLTVSWIRVKIYQFPESLWKPTFLTRCSFLPFSTIPHW